VNHDEDDGAVIAHSVNDPDRFAVIWNRYAGDVHRFVMRRLGRDLADDVTAETFAIALRQRDGFDRTRTSARPWLFGIAANLVGKHRRTEVRGLRAVARLGADPVAASFGPDDAADDRLVAAAASRELATALARLASGDRQVLLLVAWADLTYAEVAEALDIPVGTVRSRLNRARTKVRSSLAHDPTLRETSPLPRKAPA
jgi:RNA polymerase sigma-70 factor (ECF subfamily)